MKKRMIQKKITGAVLTAVFAAAILSGCGKKDAADGAPKAEETDQTGESAEEEKSAVSKESAGTEKDAEKEAEAFDPEKLKHIDRFLAGRKNVYRIDEDGGHSQVLRCTGDDEFIEYAGGDKDHYYVLVNDGNMKCTLYYWSSSGEDGSFELTLPENTGVYHSVAYDDRFYYDYYDQGDDGYPVWYFDPAKKDVVRDQETERMKEYLDSYKGRSMATLDYMSFIPGELAKTGQMYRRNTDDNTVSVFDSKGDEVYSVKPSAEGGNWLIGDDTYLFQNQEEYGTGSRISNLQCVVFNVKTGISHTLWEGKSDGERFEPLCIKDGYFYYYIEEKHPDGSPKARNFFREKKEELENEDLSGQLLASVPVWNGVFDVTLPWDNRIPDGFSVRGSRAYYLWFDDEEDSSTRGDISWRAVDMNRTDFDDDTIITKAKEGHEDFAELGYIETDHEAQTEKDFRYFTTSRDRFYFYDEVENAGAMNEALQKIYDEMAGYADETKETAYSEIFGEDAMYDLDDPDDWHPAYSYDVNFGDARRIGTGHVQVCVNDYAYYGGAHGMPGIRYILFDTETGKEVTMKDLYKGSEKEFCDIVVRYTMDDWKNAEEYRYYEPYDPSLENDRKQMFEESVSIDMIIRYDTDGIYAVYPPYAVGPYASGFIEVFIPYSELGIEEEMK